MKLDDLAKPFPTHLIKWRISHTNEANKSSMVLAYIDARHVMDRLDEVCGPENWQVRHPRTGYCEIGIKVSNYEELRPVAEINKVMPQDLSQFKEEWVWKGNGADQTKVEGTKGQFSDSAKRAAVEWGIGRYLYGLPTQWAPVTKKGKSWVISDVKALTMPDWADPSKCIFIERKVKNEVKEQTKICLEAADEVGLKQIWDEFNGEEHGVLWYLFNSQQRAAMKKLMGDE